MSAPVIDLNCDMGESEDAAQRATDLELLGIVTSANVACGGHAGTPQLMEETVRAAMERGNGGVAIGAHPGYPDRQRFGRVEIPMPASEIERMVAGQVATLGQIAGRCAGRVTHVKPHGALYHAAMFKEDVAAAFARGAMRAAPGAWLVGLAGAPGLAWWATMGAIVAAEAFADRRYEADGGLRGRTHADALITDGKEAAAQAVAIARGEGVRAVGGAHVALQAQTICVHSDTPGAAVIARAVRCGLEEAGIRVARLPT
jgi:UPF0271 protein